MKITNVDMKSLFSYGMHGALGMLMGFGFSIIISFLILPQIIIRFAPEKFSGILHTGISATMVFAIYGLYVGYIFGGKEFAYRLSLNGVAAGILSMLMRMAFFESIQAGGFIDLMFYIAFACLSFGIRKLRNMLILVVSGAIGSTAAYGAYFSGENITYYLNSNRIIDAPIIILIMFFFLLLAIVFTGSSISAGIFLAQRNAYTSRDLQWYLKILRGAGIILAVLILLFGSLFFVSYAHYASTSGSILIDPDDEQVIVYVPVLLDENGNVLEMFEKPAISGTATVRVVDIERGKFLMVNGSRTIEINLRQTHGIPEKTPEADQKFMKGFTMSTVNDVDFMNSTDVDAWVYSESNASLSFSIKRDNGWGRVLNIGTDEPVRLSRGWQQIGLSSRAYWYD